MLVTAETNKIKKTNAKCTGYIILYNSEYSSTAFYYKSYSSILTQPRDGTTVC